MQEMKFHFTLYNHPCIHPAKCSSISHDLYWSVKVCLGCYNLLIIFCRHIESEKFELQA